jgi:hypothetical protein
MKLPEKPEGKKRGRPKKQTMFFSSKKTSG